MQYHLRCHFQSCGCWWRSSSSTLLFLLHITTQRWRFRTFSTLHYTTLHSCCFSFVFVSDDSLLVYTNIYLTAFYSYTLANVSILFIYLHERQRVFPTLTCDKWMLVLFAPGKQASSILNLVSLIKEIFAYNTYILTPFIFKRQTNHEKCKHRWFICRGKMWL